MDWTAESFQEKEVRTIDECFPLRGKEGVTWINIDGCDEDVIQTIDGHLGIHPLVMEDIIDTYQRPKAEDHGSHLFLVLRMIYFNENGSGIFSEQVSLLWGENFVISFQEQERPGDVFDGVRERIRSAKGRMRKAGADYLAYSLMDAIADYYFVILERLGDRIDSLEAELMSGIRREIPSEIHGLKKNMIFLHRQMWPLRDVINSLLRDEPRLMTKATRVYLRDVYDHTTQINETIDAFRESLSAMQDVYLSSVSNRMNEVMKVLTLFSAFFIPLTFVAGIYGMNFEYMPELKWRYGYFVLLSFMAALSVCMFFYFKRKKWF
jgi:magnesium transporter